MASSPIVVGESSRGPSPSSAVQMVADLPAVSLSADAPAFATSQGWSLDAPSSTAEGIRFTQRRTPSHPSVYPPGQQSRRSHGPSYIQRSASQPPMARSHTSRSSFGGSDQLPTLLENTLKLPSLGVAMYRPTPSTAPKVTLSDRCRPDPKVVFDQEKFRRRREFSWTSTNSSSASTSRRTSMGNVHRQAPQTAGSLGAGLSVNASTAPSTIGTTSFPSPSSSIDALPSVMTPASSMIIDAEAHRNSISTGTGSPPMPRRSAAAWSKPRSWADLASRLGPGIPLANGSPFSESVNGSSANKSGNGDGSDPYNGPVTGRGRGRSGKGATALADLTSAASISDAVRQSETQFSAPLTYPRGMINTGNMCFANAILQTLIYCAPFYNLFQLLGQMLPRDFHNRTPLMEAVIHFLSEFHIIPDSVQRNFVESHALAVDALREIQAASEPFVPESLYDAMKLNKRFDTMRRGHQEDAEEFLGFFLDTLHEELQAAIAKAEARQRKKQGKATADEKVEEDEAGSEDERVVVRPTSPSEGDEWLEVGQKGKTSFTRTALTSNSPITRIFGGKLRSVLRTPGAKDSVTLEPYQPLQLDIQPPHVTTVEEALENLTHAEVISGVLTSSKNLVDATKQVFIETLPPILILHLKRFYYDDIGGVQKSSKVLGYGTTLEVPEAAISPARRGETSRTYKLFGVVYHHGRYASGGHYTVDVLRQDHSEWLHIDDTTWSIASPPQAKPLGVHVAAAPNGSNGVLPSVLAPTASPRAAHMGHTPTSSQSLPAFNEGGSAYLLFYVRQDALAADTTAGVASSTESVTSGKARSRTGTAAASSSSSSSLLPPISVRRMAEAVAAGPPPAVPGAAPRTGQRKAGTARS